MKILAYGGGTNSKAILIGCKERGIKIDLILFADTGAERPQTYRDIEQTSKWCVENGFPEIITVQQVNKAGEKITLEQLCLDGKFLPSIAYGYKGCSQKHKISPQDKFVNNWPPAKATWKSGEKITKIIGYDADEERRAKISSDDKYDYEYPLIEWGWNREDCVNAIARAGLSQPNKSACFFCPSSKKQEILELKKNNPDLFKRAIALEENAELASVKGLGRDFAWKQFIDFSEAQFELFKDSRIEMDCGCYDG